MRISKPSTTKLTPLIRVMAAGIAGFPAKLSPRETYRLPKPKQTKRETEPFQTERYQEPRPQILSADQVVRALRFCQYDKTGRRPLMTIARAAGLDRKTLYRALWSGQASEKTRAALTPILREVAAGTIGYRRRGQQWEEVELRAPIDPRLPPQPRVVLRADYQPTRCRSCGSPDYSPFEGLAGKRYMGCDGCLGEADRVMLGKR